jgi:hypothetical protein
MRLTTTQVLLRPASIREELATRRSLGERGRGWYSASPHVAVLNLEVGTLLVELIRPL